MCKTNNQWEFAIWHRELKLVLHDNLEGWGGVVGGKEVQEVARSLQEGYKSMQEVHANLWLIHVNVWQKPNQYFKAIILWLKINRFKKGYIVYSLVASKDMATYIIAPRT